MIHDQALRIHYIKYAQQVHILYRIFKCIVLQAA